ncbi:MAG: aromatic amino acid lyase, partial [Bacteroidota bacterium]
MSVYQITTDHLSYDAIKSILSGHSSLELSQECTTLVKNCRDYLDRKIAGQSAPVYGVTTGFGSLCNHSISATDLGQLQKNLVMSHACGMGERVPDEIVKIMLLLKIQSLSYGKSGI